jgi:lipoprotein-releasing system ATP-binding protein
MSQVQPPPVPSRPAAATTGAGPAILRAAGLVKSFQMGDQRFTVLKHADLALRAGEFVAIEGRSGSGKSTLMHVMGALDSADAGTLEYEGRSIFGMSGNERSALRNTQFGFVFQFYHLLPELDVLENTLLGPLIQHSWFGFRGRKRELRERAVQLLTRLDMGHRLKQSPNRLSGGERQRVAIARALMNDPKVLFADEPTGNLDAETGRQIMGVLEQLHQEQGQTIVMVTHDRSLARRADRVLVMKDGKLERAEA